jgi:hypothetical protein
VDAWRCRLRNDHVEIDQPDRAHARRRTTPSAPIRPCPPAALWPSTSLAFHAYFRMIRCREYRFR